MRMNAKMITLELTEQEAQALTNLLDLGVKGGGLNVAMAGAVLYQKIKAAVEDTRKPKTDGEAAPEIRPIGAQRAE